MIRLRAWDNEEHRMLQHKQVINIINYSERGYDIFEDETYTIMEYVKLDDTQGTEIYVGDILADVYSRSTGVIYEVVEMECGFGVIPLKRGFKRYANMGTIRLEPARYRVIGNIYKNQSLLDHKIID